MFLSNLRCHKPRNQHSGGGRTMFITLKMILVSAAGPAACSVAQSCLTLCSWQAPPPVGFFRHEYWSGLPFPTAGNLPQPGTGPVSLVSPPLTGGSLTTSPPGSWNLPENHLLKTSSDLRLEAYVSLLEDAFSWRTRQVKTPEGFKCGAREVPAIKIQN